MSDCFGSYEGRTLRERDQRTIEEMQAASAPITVVTPAEQFKVGRGNHTRSLMNCPSVFGYTPFASQYGWPGAETIDPCWLDIVMVTTGTELIPIASAGLTLDWIHGTGCYKTEVSEIDIIQKLLGKKICSHLLRVTITNICDAINEAIRYGEHIEVNTRGASRPTSYYNRVSNLQQRQGEQWNGERIQNIGITRVAPVWIHEGIQKRDGQYEWILFPRFAATMRDCMNLVGNGAAPCPLIDMNTAIPTPRVGLIGMPIKGKCRAGLPNQSHHPQFDMKNQYGLLIDAGCRILQPEPASARLSNRMHTVVLPMENPTVSEEMKNALGITIPQGTPGLWATEIEEGSGWIHSPSEFDGLQHQIQSIRRHANWAADFESNDLGIPTPSNTLDGDGDTSGRAEEWIDTWADTRGIKTVDLTEPGRPGFYHEFIRCDTCNGEVEIHSPLDHIPPETDCPHCSTAGGIQWMEKTVTGE